MDEITLPDITDKVTTGEQAATLINTLKSQHNLSVEEAATLVQRVVTLEQNGGGATLTDEEVVDAVSRHLQGTAWKGKNGLPPTAGFTLDKTTGDSPVTYSFTDTSTAGDNAISTRTLTFSSLLSPIVVAEGATVTFTLNSINLSVDLTYTVVDEVLNTDTATGTVTTAANAQNIPPVVPNQALSVEEGVDVVVTLGELTDLDGDTVTYTVTGSPDVTAGPANNQITFNSSTLGDVTLTVVGDDGEDTTTGAIVVTVFAAGSVVYPVIAKPSTQFVASGGTMVVTPALTNTGSVVSPRWSLETGHDDIVVDPLTGQTTWDTSSLTKAESFHVQLKCVALGGEGFVDFIAHVGKAPSDVLYVGTGGTYATFKDAQSVMTAGQTCVFLTGDYVGDDNCVGRTLVSELNQYPPSGTVSAYTCIMAESLGQSRFMDGTATIKFALFTGSSEADHMTFKGFHFEGGSGIALVGDTSNKLVTRLGDIKIINCGGAGQDNLVLYTRVGDNILFESCYAYGGGRYKIQANECTNVVVRRCVSRYDRSDRDPTDDPKGGVMLYNCKDFVVQNTILDIDGLSQFTSSGELVGAVGTPVTGTGVTPEGAFGTIDRCIQLNSDLRFANFDMQVSNGGGFSDVVCNDVLSYDIRPDNFYAYSYGFSEWNNFTIGEVTPRFDTTYGMVNTGGDNNFSGITNSIIHDIDFTAGGEWFVRNMSAGNVTVTYDGGTYRVATKVGLRDNNVTLFGGSTLLNQGDAGLTTGTTAVDISTDLKYLVKVEDSSAIAGITGAEILTHIGKSGTMYGETGYNTETSIPMWPFPYQEIIRKNFMEYSEVAATYSGSNYNSRVQGADATIDGNRGCAVADSSITNYVWGYRGYTVPPMNVKAIPSDGGLQIVWDKHTVTEQSNITSYNVYEFNLSTKVMSNPTNVSATTFEASFTGLNNGFDYSYVVTAVDSVKGESGYAYPVTGRPNGTPTLSPIVTLDPIATSVISGTSVTLTADGQGYTEVQWHDTSGDTGARGLSVTFTPTVSTTYKAVFVNGVGTTDSAVVAITVTSLDTTPPTVSVSLAGSTLTITLSDDIYSNSDISLQILDDGVNTGSSFTGDTLTFDLTTLALSTGDRNISVKATDPQTNTATSNTVVYASGTPIFTDNFSDTSNWTTSSMTVAGNEATLSGIATLNSDVWNGASGGSVKFDMKILASTNDFENNDMYFGITSGGSKTNCIRVQYRNRQDRDASLYHYVGGSILGTIAEKASGFGEASADPVSGSEIWKEYEFIVSGTTFIVKVDGVTTCTATLPQDINPLTGGWRFEPYDSVDCMVIRNFNMY